MNYYTHAGFMHTDEIVGYVECKLAGVCDRVVRLTDITNIPDDGIVGDIGRVHDPSAGRFDHHQGLFRRPDTGIPYATAGMIWDWYGVDICQRILESKPSIREAVAIMMRVDETFIQGIDAHDASNEYDFSPDEAMFYALCGTGKVRVMTISNAVAAMNNEDVHDHDAQLAAFYKAAEFMEILLISSIRAAAKFVETEKRFSQIADITEDIIVLSEHVPWKEIVHENYPTAKFIIAPSGHPGNPWSLLAVPVEPESRIVKIPIRRPEWFAGFIHQGRWIAGGDDADELRQVAKYSMYAY